MERVRLMQQAEVLELFGPILRQTAGRRRITDYAAVVLLLIVLALWGYSAWQNSYVPKITSITLVEGSIVVIGPEESVNERGVMAFCPGDTMIVQFELQFQGEGTIYADDAAHYQNHTVKFSDLWRDIVETGTRTYQDPWMIPPRPDMAIDGAQGAPREWVAGSYTRVISVAASNIYISRYVPPATFEVPFRIAEDCP